MSTQRWIGLVLLLVGLTTVSLNADEAKSVSEVANSDLISNTGSGDSCCGQVGCGCNSCCRSPMWLRSDGLLWWMKGADVPVLVTQGPPNAARADAGRLDRGATPLYGGGRIQDEVRFGGRITAGMWLDDCECDAFEVSYLYLGQDTNADFTAGPSTGNPILARPYYNLTSGQEDALLAAYPGVVDGSITVNASSELHSATATYRSNYSNICGVRTDFLIGYRYLRFRDSLSIMENLVNRDPAIVAPGTRFDTFDRFAMENDFHGLDLGLSRTYDRGCYSFTVLGKVAVGNMRQVSDVSGATSVTNAGGGAPVVADGGLFALATNSFKRADDELAFIPELNLTLDYQVNDRLDLSIGYTLMYVTNVLRAGQQIDRVVNTTQLPRATGPFVDAARPSPQFNDSTIWAQGLTLGGVFTF